MMNATEFRAQVEALETPAIENCIAQIVARSSTATRAGIAFNCFSLDALSNDQRVSIAREVLAERMAQAEALVQAAFEVAEVEAAPIKAKAEPKKPCSFHRFIRRFYAIARDKGLDLKDGDGMRAAFSNYLGREVSSREELNGADWEYLGNAVKRGLLAW